MHCLQALIPNSTFFSLCVSLRAGTGKGVDDERDKLLTPFLMQSTASHACHPEEQKHNAMKNYRTMEMVRSPQTGATLQPLFGVRFLYGLK